ncbi:hypothetical protein P2318_03235 [Myxococcaceae bacterium GXIMD 01537]
MSETLDRNAPPPAAEPASDAPIFKAFVERKPSRFRRWALLGLPLVLGAGAWALSRAQTTALQLITPHGIITVRHGMSPNEVQGLLGRPLTLETGADGSECYRYGRPTMKAPSFRVFTACYEDGELERLTERKFESWSLDPRQLPPAGEKGPG